ncbi:AraC family transcriptional regulator (plasmid) [Neorhizobium sp. SOG26]|uniref:AraC family transcriptional regulator n=1 Tax=Neorhizobium sp. SOG26 TaxID=2060726 RepID=UPI000E5689D3|nr:AraC family transcriptional regulator [Neorhizobium sp. SOG26]
MERMEARFHGNGFLPHRHDTYALGLTMHGVQTFRYRGSPRFSQPGNVIVLHPDEVHDGAAGTDVGLIYRMIYLPPTLVAEAFDHRTALPFVADPVVSDPALRHALADLLADLDEQPDDLLIDDALARIAAALGRQAGVVRGKVQPVARLAVLAARDYLDVQVATNVTSADLERVTQLDRYELARHFRRLLGTSPHRYLVMRRLDRGKEMLVSGSSLADAALGSGFSDQAHFTRHFRNAFGLPPGRWLNLQRNF